MKAHGKIRQEPGGCGPPIGPFAGEVVPVSKRIFDLVTAAAGLVLFAPMLGLVSLAIKLESRGPVFSREVRYGYKNRAIRVLKFRTHAVSDGGDTCCPAPTQVGRILRRTGIDQLPQLFSVIAGDLSIVGPQPFSGKQDFFVRQPASSLGDVRAGMTGLAQVMLSRGELRSIEQRLDADRYYAENWSLLLDIKIVLLTIFSRSNADRHAIQ